MDSLQPAASLLKTNPDFPYFPAYAEYLLQSRLGEFCAALLRASREVNIPILRYFKEIPDDQLIAMGMDRNKEMLEQLSQGRIEDIIQNSTKTWVENQLPMVQRDQILADDISLVSFTRRKVFRDMLSEYTSDIGRFTQIMEEVDRFTLMMDTRLYNTFIDLQQEKINGINSALKKRESQLLEAQEIGQIGSFEWDMSGANSSYSPQMFKIFEFEQTTGLPSFLDDVHPDDRERLASAISQALKDGNLDCEYRYLKNGKEKMIWSRGKGFFEGAKVVKMVGTIMDITERNKAMDRLLQSETLYKQAQALTHIGNWSWEITADHVNWSDEMYRIYGLEPQSLVITLETFLGFVHPDDKEKRLADIQKSLQTLIVEEYYFRIITKKGETKVLRGRGEIKSDKDGKAFMIMGTCQDITKEYQLNQELKERQEYTSKLNASLEHTNEELRRSNSELESFNFVASHDLKEPLRKIRMFSDLIMEEAGSVSGPASQYIQKMHQAAGRMQRLIDDFLSFSKTSANEQQFEPVDLSAVLIDVKSDLADLIAEKKATIFAHRLPVIEAIPFQIKQLFANLITNSIKYSKADVAPIVTISTMIVDGSETGIPGAAAGRKFQSISVADNGIGFEPQYEEKIFELFQRLHTREQYSGTGIGLSICKRIAENHGGFIKARSSVNSGAVFTVFLPLKYQITEESL